MKLIFFLIILYIVKHAARVDLKMVVVWLIVSGFFYVCSVANLNENGLSMFFSLVFLANKQTQYLD